MFKLKFINKKNLSLFLALIAIYSHNSSAYGGSFFGGGGGGGETVDPSYAEDAEQMRDEAVQIYRDAAKKSGNEIFSQIADALSSAQLLSGDLDTCYGGGKDLVCSAMTYPSQGATYFCTRPSLPLVLHEAAHLIQTGGQMEGPEAECEADKNMVMAFYYGRGEVEHGLYDRIYHCPGNLDLERKFRSGGR